MTNNPHESGTEPSNQEIARLRILPEDRYIKAIIDTVTDIAEANGISEIDATNLDKVLIDIFGNIVKYGFKGDTCEPIEVIISKHLHSFIVALEDRGLPFDYEKLEHGEDTRFTSYLSKGYADHVRFLSLGNKGNRIEIVKNLPASDIRHEMDISEHHEHMKSEPADPGENITVGDFNIEDVHDLVRLVYKCYGYTYANEFMYIPEQIEARIDSNLMTSCATYNSTDEIIGHLALTYNKAGAGVAESGEAVVDPRYRGRGLFQKMKHYLRDYAESNNIVGIYGEAVTVHPYSQKGSLELGAHETGFLLGYSPGTVSFQNISESGKPRRQSIALMFTPVLPGEKKNIYVPSDYENLIGPIYNNIGFERNIIAENKKSDYEYPHDGHITVSLRPDHNQGIITVDEFGSKTITEISFHLKQLRLQRVDCIYVDLPINNKGAGVIASHLRNMGFFFGYVIPEFADSDVLRLQLLNNVDISKDDIKTASKFGQNLLVAILDEMSQAS